MNIAPETFTIECNRAISKIEYPNLNPENNEWQTLINPPIQLRKGDQVTISNIFLNERGASSDVISFNSDPKTNNQNNKTRIVFSFYAMNDGTCDKRNGLDILNNPEGISEYIEKNTYGFAPLWRRQPTAIKIRETNNPDDSSYPYQNLFFKGFTNGILGDQYALIAYEDRWLPGLYHNKVTCNQFENTSKNVFDQRTIIYFKASTEELVFKLDGDADFDFSGLSAPGTISYIRTLGIAGANTDYIYLDNYYLCTNKNEDEVMFDSNSNGSNIYVTSTTQIEGLSGQDIITFPNDPLFNARIYVGMYLSSAIPFIVNNATILAISPATEIDAPETVIYNNTSLIGGNTVRVSDITQLQKHMVLNDDIPAGSLITDLTLDVFPTNPIQLQIIDSVLSGTNVLRVPAFMLVDNSPNMMVEDVSQTRLNYINQNIGGGITQFTLNQRKWMTKTTTLDASSQQNLGVDNFGYIPVPHDNNLFVGQYIEESNFVDTNCKIRKIIPFVEVNNLVSNVYGGETVGNFYVDVFTTGITLLDANDNEPSLFNITSGTVTSEAFPGTANITHTESQGNHIRVFMDKKIQTPVADNTPVNKILIVPETQTGRTIFLQGIVDDFPIHSFIWDAAGGGHFTYNTEILFAQTTTLYPGYVRITLSKSIVNPIINNANVARIGFVDEITINQLDTTSKYILPDKPLLDGVGSNQVIPFYSNLLDPTQTVYIGLELISTDIPAGTRITQVVNSTDGSDRQTITIDTPTSGGMSEFQQIETQQRAFGNNNFFIDSYLFDANGNVNLTLSNNIPFEMASHSSIQIKKQYPNQGTVTMDNNFTGELNEGDTITFKLVDRNVQISSNVVTTIPAGTKFYFHTIPSGPSGVTAVTWDFVSSNKGFEYGSPTDLGMIESDGVKVNDNLFTTILTRAGTFSGNYLQQFNVVNDVVKDNVTVQVSSFINTITETIGTLEVNENSILIGYLNSDLPIGSTTISLRMPPGFDVDLTQTLFNIQRGFVFKCIDINTNEVEYIRVQNGVNEPKVTTATYNWVAPNLIITEVLRGQLGSTELDLTADATIVNFFNQIPQKTKINAKIGKVFNQGFTAGGGGAYGTSYLFGTNTNTELLDLVKDVNKVPYNVSGTSKATYIMGNIPKNYQSFYNAVFTNEDVLHRDYLDIDLGGQTNLTPTDITEKFNQIAQKPTDKRNNYSFEGESEGIILPGTANMSIPTNKTFFPIVGIPVAPETNSGSHEYPGFSNMPSEENMGSFYFKCKYANYGSVNNGGIDGEVIIIPRNGTYRGNFSTGILAPDVPPALNFPQQLLEDFPDNFPTVYYSQMVGCSDFSMNYNSNKNRFELKTHQIYTTYSSTDATGQLATKVFYPYTRQYYNNGNNKPVGQTYQDRFGGINMECWSAPTILPGQNDPLSYTTDPYQIDTIDELVQVGRRFWNKLGFSDDQIINSRGSTIDNFGLRVLNGTSGNKIDVSFSYVPNEISSNSLASPQGLPLPGAGSPLITYVPYDATSIGGISLGINTTPTPDVLFEISNHSVSYNLPSTIGNPFNNDFQKRTRTGAGTEGDPYVYTPATGTPNPDNVENPGYNIAFTGDIEGLTAVTLPVKTTHPYFLLFCKEFSGNNNFYTTFNKGALQGEAMATISRLYSSMDFYYSYQSPQAFFLKNDITLSTITNRILNSDMSSPNTIGDNSSVIYQIIRQNPKPIPLPPTIQEQQNEYYQQQAELEETQRKIQQSNGLVGVQNVINQITQAIITPSDNENELINRILGNAESLNIGKMNPNQLKKEIATNPNMANILNDIQTLQGHTRSIENDSPPPLEVTDGFVTAPSSIFSTPYETPGFATPEEIASRPIDPDELRDALGRAQIEESILRGRVDPVQVTTGGRPRTLDFRPIELQELTPTAELSQREQILQEPESRIVGEGGRILRNARLALAQRISDRNTNLSGEERIIQLLPDGRGQEGEPRRDN
tara:strand:- start:208 stop:6090 length:5883 start_codon:yes stop_codon:yes gene_type:complete